MIGQSSYSFSVGFSIFLTNESVFLSSTRQGLVSEDDIEYHSFEEIATTPAIESSQAPAEFQGLVDEMKRFKSEFDAVKELPDSQHDLGSFWLRKTKKPVLAVLLVRRKDGTLKLYRGTNMEVSMPTGSLCAERNVIGSALADDITLKRENLVAVAVLSASLEKSSGADRFNLFNSFENVSLHEASTPSLVLPLPLSLPPPAVGRISRSNSLCDLLGYSPDREGSEGSMKGPAGDGIEKSRSGSTTTGSLEPVLCKPAASPRRGVDIRNLHLMTGPSSSGSLLRDEPEARQFKERGRVVQRIGVEHNDMNPLKPCGACSEWIKKIVEQNPNFSIVTFTDSNCSGIYIEQIDSS